MRYLCTHCKKFVSPKNVIVTNGKPMVGPHGKCVGYHPVRSFGQPRPVPPALLEKGRLGRMMRERTPGSIERIVADLEEMVSR